MSDFVLLMAILVGRVVKHLWRQETAEIQSSSDLLSRLFFQIVRAAMVPGPAAGHQSLETSKASNCLPPELIIDAGKKWTFEY